MRLISFFFKRSLKPKNQNRLLLWGRKSSILLISDPGGGRNQLSSERFLTFLRTEITWILFTIVLLPLYLLSSQVPHTHAEVSHLSTASFASCTYCQRRLCRREGLYFSHGSDRSSSSSSSDTTASLLLLLLCAAAAATPAAAVQKQKQ